MIQNRPYGDKSFPLEKITIGHMDYYFNLEHDYCHVIAHQKDGGWIKYIWDAMFEGSSVNELYNRIKKKK